MKKILAVDDEALNLEIIQDILEMADYQVLTALDGQQALNILAENEDISVIVLDRMMPVMNGMQFMEIVKKEEKYNDIPVIMQTAAASQKEVLEGINAGVYYYLTKPYDAELLLSIVRAAEKDAEHKEKMISEVKDLQFALGMMEEATFHFRTLNEAKNLACFLASCFPAPERVVLGLSEIMINAVEHGNLNITYEEKSKLIQEGNWRIEIEKRLAKPEYQDRIAKVHYQSQDDCVKVTVSDEGNGFDWQEKMNFDNMDMTAPNGRGIMMASNISFDEITYNDKGNTAICTVKK